MISSSQIGLLSNRPTPYYAYNLGLLDQTLKACQDAASKHRFHVHYALKANTNPRILQKIVAAGFGADCVSGNEVNHAIKYGFSPKKTVFAGVGKSDKEIIDALNQDILCFNCESIEEITVLNELAAKLNKVARIALRINPNVNANTHHYITTGLEENKFGISQQQLPDILHASQSWKNIDICGLHFHIGSQITDLSVFRNLCTRVNEFNKWFQDQHFNIKIVNVGGGLGVDYNHPERNQIPDFEAYFEVFKRFLEVLPSQEVHFELGRALVAQCGDLITRLLYVKKGLKTQFAILDAGMTELLRPALYQAKHKIINLSNLNGEEQAYDVVGPVCESSDCFAKAVMLPISQRGDFFALRTAGAYGEVMASHYNLRELNEALFY